jgi:hypothetical protein
MKDTLVEDDIKAEVTKDVPRRRLLELKNILKSLLFGDKQISKKYLASKLPNITDIEATTAIKIVNFVKPYIPDKNFAHQIPFVLVTNKILKSIGHGKQAVKLLSIVNSSNLYSLFNNIATLCTLFCSSTVNKRMKICDYRNNAI